MFAVRGVVVCLSIFVMIYVVSSVLVCALWHGAQSYGLRQSAKRCADIFFFLRVAPFMGAMGITLVLAVPSFLLLEPRLADEPMSALPVTLAFCGIAFLLSGIWKAGAALMQASRMIASWSNEARVVDQGLADSGDSLLMLCTSATAPPLTTAGILRPSLWLSQAARFVLTERELNTALRHESVHVCRKDNLRKMILRLVAFPAMAELETAWHEASEMAADDAAVNSASEALDLAAALIKLSRLSPLDVPPTLTTALVHTPSQSVNARVRRLIAWTQPRDLRQEYSLRYALGATVVIAATLAATYTQLLLQVHEATEWLVR
jgi:beta-lactamase regulating signal transducer with metallopeptidase domain